MRCGFHLAFLGNLVLIGMMPLLLPARIVVHFGANGNPDGWGTVFEGMAALGGALLLIYLILWGSAWLVKVCPVGLINIPINAKHWKSEENIPEMRRIMGTFLYEFFACIMIFMFAETAILIHANLQNPPKADPMLFVATLVFLGIYFIWWLVRCSLAFRIPKENESRNS